MADKQAVNAATDWKARIAVVGAAVGEEWECLSSVYDDNWTSAYCGEFRRFAAERGWERAHIECGWLDHLPWTAIEYYGRHPDPAECARRDVFRCERLAADA